MINSKSTFFFKAKEKCERHGNELDCFISLKGLCYAVLWNLTCYKKVPYTTKTRGCVGERHLCINQLSKHINKGLDTWQDIAHMDHRPLYPQR
jgi:hypothetical protein